MNKETKIKIITFLGNGKVEIQYNQTVGDNSHGQFRVDISEKKYFELTRKGKLEQYFNNNDNREQ